MEQPAQVMPMTKKEFNDTYWFSPLQMVTLINPKKDDYPFMVEGRNYLIRAGVKEKVPGTIANVYLSQMTRIIAQDEDKMSFLSDYALMKQYYDRLIVDVENLIAEDRSQPAYLSNVPETMKAAAEPETPPWQQPAPKAPEAEHTPAEPPVTKESTKEFEFEGAKYKMTIDKNDKENFFKDGTRISAADYSKAASMI